MPANCCSIYFTCLKCEMLTQEKYNTEGNFCCRMWEEASWEHPELGLLEQHLSLGCPCPRRGSSQIPGTKVFGMELGGPRKMSTVPKLSVQRGNHRRKADSSLQGTDTGVQSKREFPGAPATDFSYPLFHIISALHPPTPTAQAAQQNPFL